MLNIRFFRTAVSLVVLLLGITCGCAPEATTPVTVQLRWTHSAQFGGLYAAQQAGYFASHGLMTTLLPGGPGIDPIETVLSGQAQFGIAGADTLLLARSQGKPVTAVAMIYQRSPIVFFTAADSGINNPAQFAGKTIRATPDLVPTLRAMMSFVNIPPDAYDIVELPSDVSLFATGDVPIWGGFLTGLALQVQEAGHNINIVYPDDFGVHFYADTLFTTDTLIAESPELVQNVVLSVMEGVAFAVSNPDDVGQMVVEVNPQADPAFESKRMAASIPLIHSGTTRIGWMDEQQWQTMQEALQAHGVLTQRIDVADVFTVEFVAKVPESVK